MAANEHPIKRVTSFVLEEWAMMLVEPAGDAEGVFNQQAPFFRVSAYYQGVFDGDLTIICQGPFLDVLARNVLGVEDDAAISDEERWDAVKELANIISGNFLVEAYGEETVFDLPSFDLKRCEWGEAAAYIQEKLGRLHGETAAVFIADSWPIFVSFDISATEYPGSAGGAE